MPLFAEERIWVDAGALTRSCLARLSQLVAQNPRGLPHHRQSAVVQCPLTITWCSVPGHRASHVSAYLLRGFRSLMPFVQLVNSVPTPHTQNVTPHPDHDQEGLVAFALVTFLLA